MNTKFELKEHLSSLKERDFKSCFSQDPNLGPRHSMEDFVIFLPDLLGN